MTNERARCTCGEFVLDGHLTCGRLECNESAARQRRDEAFARQVRASRTVRVLLSGFCDRPHNRTPRIAVRIKVFEDQSTIAFADVCCPDCGFVYTAFQVRPYDGEVIRP